MRNRKIVKLSPLNPPPISEMGRLRFGGEFRPKITESASSPSLAPFFTSQHWRCVQRPHGQGGCRRYHFLLGQHLSQNLGLSPLTVTPGPGGSWVVGSEPSGSQAFSLSPAPPVPQGWAHLSLEHLAELGQHGGAQGGGRADEGPSAGALELNICRRDQSPQAG